MKSNKGNKGKRENKTKSFGLRSYLWKELKGLLKKQPVPEEKLDRSEGITNWETASNSTQNNFPQQLLQDVQNSPVGSAAMDVWHEFVQGGGFIDPNAGTMKVNDKENLDSLNGKVSSDITLLWGFAVHIAYQLDGAPAKYNHLPFESTRLGILDEDGIAKDIKYNPYFGIPESFKKEYTKWYYTYNPNPQDVVKEIENHNARLADEDDKEIDKPYPGQVYWFSIEKPLSRVYPVPFYYSGINWFRVDAEIPQFHERNIKNNFLLSVILNVFGHPDDPAGEKDADGNYTSTAGEQLDLQMRSFNSKDGGVFVNWIQRADEAAKLEAFPTNANDQLFITLDNQATDKISIATKVPRILIGIVTSGKLGDSQEILNAIRVMQGRTKRMRDLLSSQYKKIFTGYADAVNIQSYEIKNINPVNILADWVVGELTTEEKRQYIEKHFDVELIEALPAVETEEEPAEKPSLKLNGNG